MAKFTKWEDYVRAKDSGNLDEHLSSLSENRAKERAKDVQVTGEPLDAGYRVEDEYKKMLDFLRGKANVPKPPQPPKEAPKGWFVVDEASRGFWVNGAWSQDEALASEALFDSEKGAKEVARVVGGIAIPAEEILG